MEETYKILVINLGSTSTKIAIYENETQVQDADLDLSEEELKNYGTPQERHDYRRKDIENYLDSIGMKVSDFDLIACRGSGGIGEQKSGAYLIDEAYCDMIDEAGGFAPHASYLGPRIAYDLARENGINAYIYDTEGMTEFEPIALLSGHKEWPKVYGGHMLSQKAAGRKAGEALGGKYEDFNFVISHLGGGITTSAHRHGRVIDTNGDGYAPERAGSIPMLAVSHFVHVAYSGKYNEQEMMRELVGKGGLVSYLGTSELIEVEKRIEEGDEEAKFYYDGMVYQLAMDIAGMASALDFNVDRIVFTGGMAYSKRLIGDLERKTKFLAPMMVFPGSLEMESLACGALRAFKGEEICWRYTPEGNVLVE